jgi:hypothetical protein
MKKLIIIATLLFAVNCEGQEEKNHASLIYKFNPDSILNRLDKIEKWIHEESVKIHNNQTIIDLLKADSATITLIPIFTPYDTGGAQYEPITHPNADVTIYPERDEIEVVITGGWTITASAERKDISWELTKYVYGIKKLSMEEIVQPLIRPSGLQLLRTVHGTKTITPQSDKVVIRWEKQ